MLPASQKILTSQKAIAQYIGVKKRPNVCYNVSLIEPGEEETKETEFKSLQEVICHLEKSRNVLMTYQNIYLQTARIVVFTDSLFSIAM